MIGRRDPARGKAKLRREHPSIAIRSELQDANHHLLAAEMALTDLVTWLEGEGGSITLELRTWQERVTQMRLDFDRDLSRQPFM